LANQTVETTIALKYVHLIEMFEQFINTLPNLKQLVRVLRTSKQSKNSTNMRKKQALLALESKGIKSRNMKAMIMSQAALSPVNAFGRTQPQKNMNTIIKSSAMLDIFKSIVAMFRDMHSHLAITLRSKQMSKGYRVTMTFGFKDTIKGYSDTYFEKNKETGFTRRFQGYDPIKAHFDVTPRQVYLRRLVFGDLETDDGSFYPVSLFHKNGSVFTMPELVDFGLISNSTVLRNGRQHFLIGKALTIHEHGGTNWFKKHSTQNTFKNHILGDRYLFGLFNHPLNYNMIRYQASAAATNEIANAKRLVTIEKKAHNRKRDMVENLKNLPPIRTSTGRLVYPGGKRSRNSLRRVEHMTDSPLPENLTRMWTSLKLGNTSKKRRAPSSMSRQSKRSK
jgi:hypothetical protein